jgi:hypothetical protein
MQRERLQSKVTTSDTLRRSVIYRRGATGEAHEAPTAPALSAGGTSNAALAR